MPGEPRVAPVVCAGVSLLLFAAPMLVPVLGTLANIFSPAPLYLLYRRYGTRAGRWGLCLAILGALVGFQLLAPAEGIYFLLYGAMAMALGEAWRRGLSDSAAVASAAVAGGITALALVLMAVWSSAGPLEEAWQAFWQAQVETIRVAYQSEGLKPEEIAAISQYLLALGQILLRISLGLLGAVVILAAWGNLLVVRRIAPGADPEDLTLWRAPEHLVWVLIVAGVATAVGEGVLFWAGICLLIILAAVYFLQGIAVAAFWLTRKAAPPWLRWAVYLLVVIMEPLLVLVVLAGLFDMWFNFRRLGAKPAA